MQRGLSVYIAAAALAASVSLVVFAQQGPPSAARLSV